AERLMKQAEKFQRPVLTLINTAGADAAPDSEEYGIGEAIASMLITMSELTVPTLAIILGEGGSGGAIALALSDQVWMLDNSIYFVERLESSRRGGRYYETDCNGAQGTYRH